MSVKAVNEIVMMPIEKIVPYDKNPRRNSKTVELLVKVIPVVGFNVPLVLDKDNVIVKGHARYRAAVALGMTEVPCVISDADPEQIKLDRIADNKVFEFSRWLNEELLHEVDMIDLGIDMGEFGLPTIRVDDLPAFEVDEEDYVADEEDEERRRRFAEMMAQVEELRRATPVEITPQMAIDHAKEAQREEAGVPPKYYSVVCEKCGSVMFVREGDAMVWE